MELARILWSVFVLYTCSAGAESRFAKNPNLDENKAVLVGAANGLEGIDYDIRNMDEILRKTYAFDVTRLENGAGTVVGIENALQESAAKAHWYGTLLFYFSGHGAPGVLLAENSKIMKIQVVRDAIRRGRESVGPLSRLILVYDSCYSGSLLDLVQRTLGLALPWDPEIASMHFTQSVVDTFIDDSPRAPEPLWKSVFVFASSRADETSIASPTGSEFTNAFVKAFREVSKQNESIGTFVAKTQDYTNGHHPVARMVPDSIGSEPLLQQSR